MSAICFAISRPVWYRCSGSFAIAFVINTSSSGGKRASKAVAGTGCRFITLKLTVAALLPWNGRCPVSIA
jgi:hypothetical protein